MGNDMVKCLNCGAELEIGDWPFCPHGSVSRRWASSFDPVVIHRGKNGSVRFPARGDARVPEGYAKVELRTIQEIRRFEREINQQERAIHDDHQAREEHALTPDRSARRAEVRDAMRRMTPLGRDFARLAMKRNDERPRGNFDAGFHIEVFEQDSSNREPHCDQRTDWKERKA